MQWQILGGAEIKPIAQKFLLRNFREELQHLYKDNCAFWEGHGDCLICHSNHKIIIDTPDVLMGGFPCTPFSNMGPKTGVHHDRFQTVEDFQKYLESRKPNGFIIEEVPEFGKMIDPRTGETFLKGLMKKAVKAGLATRALTIDLSTFVKVSRERLFIFGCGPKLGHKDGANWITARINDVKSKLAQRGAAKDVVGDFGVVQLDDPEEVARRTSKAAEVQHPSFQSTYPLLF